MRHFFRLRFPKVERILLVESGSRHLIENLLPTLGEYWPEVPIDLVTCYAGKPAGLDSSHAYRVSGYAGRAGRKRLYGELGAQGYAVMGIICSGEPIMTKWKWALAARVPAKVFVLNENGDFFWLDRSQLGTMCRFVLFRAGLSGAQAAPTLLRLLLFPFTVLYLLLYAAAVHTRRALRKEFHP
ncbi:MAG: hypothetical protein AAB225_24835 [Acidobacteriota bacterium]